MAHASNSASSISIRYDTRSFFPVKHVTAKAKQVIAPGRRDDMPPPMAVRLAVRKSLVASGGSAAGSQRAYSLRQLRA